MKKLFLKISQYSQKNTGVFKNTYFEEHLQTAASGVYFLN